jgi:hypothetical protein
MSSKEYFCPGFAAAEETSICAPWMRFWSRSHLSSDRISPVAADDAAQVRHIRGSIPISRIVRIMAIILHR